MCGIFAYMGDKNTVAFCVNGLKKLEYRGYDSSGLAGVQGGALFLCKEVGKISVLEKALASKSPNLQAAIAHTRWATHGKPSQINAHPQVDQKKTVAVVHNGVIENYALLREKLQKEDQIVFASETDTEVIAHTVSKYYRGDFLKAVQETCKELEGSYAIALIHVKHPDQIIAVADRCPLIVAFSKKTKELFVCSDVEGLPLLNLDLYYLVDGETAFLEKGKEPVFFDKKEKSLLKERESRKRKGDDLSKGVFEHFMLKEIFDQAHTVRDAMLHRYDEIHQTAYFKELSLDPEILKKVKKIVIIGCGSS